AASSQRRRSVVRAGRPSARSGWHGGNRGPRGFGGVRGTRNASHILESRSRSDALSAGNDRQHLPLNSGNSWDERAYRRLVARRVLKVRLRTPRLIIGIAARRAISVDPVVSLRYE